MPEDLMSKDLKKKINTIISTIVKEKTSLDIEISPDMSLIEDGILDSMSIVDVVQALQTEFDIDILVPDMTVNNFDTIELIINFVEERLL